MSFERFSRRIELRGKQTPEAVNKIVKKTALVVDQAIVSGTPVDTGRARSNWLVSLNAPREDVEDPPGGPRGSGDRGANLVAAQQKAIEQARAVVSGRKPGQTVFITNNVEYIGLLNQGSSAQAPANFVQTAIDAGVAAIRASVFRTSR